ncbi:MAG: response regulator [Alphaproteobacteria bacterium]|nr:response regulator [Alphaproteobacteria bacterium]MBQ9236189.1 response regulator [Alphaproteobacteria bacterium]
MNDVSNKQINWDAITCLIVDDDKFSRTFTKTALYQIGIKNTREAATSQEAAEIIRSYKIDVLLLDHQLPEPSGLDLARQIKEGKIGDNKDLPIIMVTIDTKEKTVLDAKNIGIHEYLVKPISPLALRKRICTAFGIKERV